MSINPSRTRRLIAATALTLGALSVLAIGADHIQQYYFDNYSTVPTIGTLFLLNFISSMIVASGCSRRLDDWPDAMRTQCARCSR